MNSQAIIEGKQSQQVVLEEIKNITIDGEKKLHERKDLSPAIQLSECAIVDNSHELAPDSLYDEDLLDRNIIEKAIRCFENGNLSEFKNLKITQGQLFQPIIFKARKTSLHRYAALYCQQQNVLDFLYETYLKLKNPTAECFTNIIYFNQPENEIKRLLAANISIDVIDDRGWTALMIAAIYDRAQVIKDLLANGASPYLSFSLAIKQRDLFQTECLIKHIDIHTIFSKSGNTVLQLAAESGDAVIFTAVLENKQREALLNLVPVENQAIFRALIIFEKLRRYNRSVATKQKIDVNFSSIGICIHTIENQDIYELNVLLKYRYISTSLKFQQVYTKHLIKILQKPAETQTKNKLEDIAISLIEGGADVNTIIISTKKPLLIQAVENGYDRVAQDLLERDADVSIQDMQGNTALHVAAQVENLKLFGSLVKRTADLKAKNHLNETPLDVIREHPKLSAHAKYHFELVITIEMEDRLLKRSIRNCENYWFVYKVAEIRPKMEIKNLKKSISRNRNKLKNLKRTKNSELNLSGVFLSGIEPSCTGVSIENKIKEELISMSADANVSVMSRLIYNWNFSIKNLGLKILDISKTMIDFDSLGQLSSFLRCYHELEILRLDYNAVGGTYIRGPKKTTWFNQQTSAIEVLSRALYGYRNLRILGLDGVGLDYLDSEALVEMINSLDAFVHLSFDDNPSLEDAQNTKLNETMLHARGRAELLGYPLNENKEPHWKERIEKIGRCYRVKEVVSETDISAVAKKLISPCQNAYEHAQELLRGNFRGREFYFHEEEVAGDGECFFTTIGASREEVVKVLLTLKTNEKSRSSMIDEIKNALISQDWVIKSEDAEECTQLLREYHASQEERNACLGKIRANLDDLPYFSNDTFSQSLRWLSEHSYKEQASDLKKSDLKALQIENKLNLFCKKTTVFCAYVQALGENLWLGYQSALLFAKAKHMSLYIWARKHDKELKLQSFNIAEEERQIIHALHTGSFTHFNLLVESPASESEFYPELDTKSSKEIKIAVETKKGKQTGKDEIPTWEILYDTTLELITAFNPNPLRYKVIKGKYDSKGSLNSFEEMQLRAAIANNKLVKLLRCKENSLPKSKDFADLVEIFAEFMLSEELEFNLGANYHIQLKGREKKQDQASVPMVVDLFKEWLQVCENTSKYYQKSQKKFHQGKDEPSNSLTDQQRWFKAYFFRELDAFYIASGAIHSKVITVDTPVTHREQVMKNLKEAGFAALLAIPAIGELGSRLINLMGTAPEMVLSIVHSLEKTKFLAELAHTLELLESAGELIEEAPRIHRLLHWIGNAPRKIFEISGWSYLNTEKRLENFYESFYDMDDFNDKKKGFFHYFCHRYEAQLDMIGSKDAGRWGLLSAEHLKQALMLGLLRGSPALSLTDFVTLGMQWISYIPLSSSLPLKLRAGGDISADTLLRGSGLYFYYQDQIVRFCWSSFTMQALEPYAKYQWKQHLPYPENYLFAGLRFADQEEIDHLIKQLKNEVSSQHQEPEDQLEYYAVSMLNGKKAGLTNVPLNTLVMERKKGCLIAHWRIDDTLIQQSLKETEVADIIKMLPKIGEISKDRDLIKDISSKYGCIHHIVLGQKQGKQIACLTWKVDKPSLVRLISKYGIIKSAKATPCMWLTQEMETSTLKKRVSHLEAENKLIKKIIEKPKAGFSREEIKKMIEEENFSLKERVSKLEAAKTEKDKRLETLEKNSKCV